MRCYRVVLTSSAEKELHHLPAKVVARVMSRLEILQSNPRPSGCKKLTGGDREWRLRVSDYRIIYVIDDTAQTIDVTVIGHRREVYD